MQRKKLARPAETNQVLRELLVSLEDDSIECPDALMPFIYEKTESVGDYLSPKALTVLVEPRSLVDDAIHSLNELAKKAEGTSVTVESLYLSANGLNFGINTRATYVSIMRIGVELDGELVVKRVDVAGDPEKLFGRLRSLVDAGFTVVFSVPHFRARNEMKLSLVDLGIPIKEVLDVLGSSTDDALEEQEGETPTKEEGHASLEKGNVAHTTLTPAGNMRPSFGLSKALKRGVVNIVDVEIPLGMIFPAAKLALISLADTQGSMTVRKRRRVDITEITFPYKPGDYVVHAAHGVAFFREIVRRKLAGLSATTCCLNMPKGTNSMFLLNSLIVLRAMLVPREQAHV